MGAPMTRVVFAEDGLHGSVGDPVLGGVTFLNEVMSRYPDAISFAPGAPHPDFVSTVDVAASLRRFERHIQETRHWSPARVRTWLHQYGPSRGLINDLLADALRADVGVDVDPEAIVVTVGCQEAILLTLRALFAGPRDLFAVADPCYVGAAGAARLLDIPVVPIPETVAGLDLDALAGSCAAARRRGERVRALYVAPDFANPSGSVLGLAARERLLDLAEREDLMILEDSTYGFTARPGAVPPPLKVLDRYGRVLHLGTFAKIGLPAARVGYVVADQTVVGPSGTRMLAEDLAAIKSMVTVNTSPIGQAVVGGLLLEYSGSIAALAAEKAERYRHSLDLLLAELSEHLPPTVSWNNPVGGFFVRISVPVPADTALLDRSAREYGVLWTPMRQFHLAGGGTHELRLSCSFLDDDRIVEGARRLGRFLTDLPHL
ncbi:PLP-dependent aminotransferase family protein [Amycolatopsis keratiniphila]|uniref:Aminotransferase n=1 Tax=Amycolatopsis keratiniphila TaxID=129921 RepID=R4SZG0_9PSEU|nr:PLP-dependent aminotransferase family protein [Amycolatopsis keratiniphila]AGM07910.1 aminotransferase [Amycolatopsis keratiniphila]